MNITRWLALSACVLFTGACALISSDPETKRVEGPQFEAEDYARNAKEYFDAGDWARAREQWQRQLEKQPGEWMAELGLASADHWIGSAALDRGNGREARQLLTRSLEGASRLWDGTLEKDTLSATPLPKAQWKAALYVALNRRALADLGTLEGRALREEAARRGRHEPTTVEMLQRAERAESESRKLLSGASELFARLRQMEHPSPEVILQTAELQQRTGDVAAAEAGFRDWLGLSAASLTQWKAQFDATSAVDDAKLRKAQREVIRGKIRSVESKRIAVLVRLGNMAFDRGEEILKHAGVVPSAEAARDAKRCFSLAVDDLNAAFATDENRIDLLLKTAQCQGRLEQWELGLANLQRYKQARAQRGDAFDQDLAAASRLEAEFAAKGRLRRSANVP